MRKTRIPAWSQTMIPVYVDQDDSLKPNTIYYITHQESMVKKFGIYAASGIVLGDQPIKRILLANIKS